MKIKSRSSMKKFNLMKRFFIRFKAIILNLKIKLTGRGFQVFILTVRAVSCALSTVLMSKYTNRNNLIDLRCPRPFGKLDIGRMSIGK
jgi:hypothetical protein